MLIEVRLVHSSKAYFPISVTLEGMFIEVRLLHPSKACAPISVTPEGMLIEVRYLLLKNAPLAMARKSLSNTILPMPSSEYVFETMFATSSFSPYAK